MAGLDVRIISDSGVLDLLMRIDEGHLVTEDEKQLLCSVTRIHWNKVSKLPKSLGMLETLKILDLSFSEVSDLSILSNLSSLSILSLDGTQVRDISGLSNLTSLLSLSLNATKVSDISALSNLQSLSSLSLSNTQVSDISVLSNLQSLSHLYLSGTQVSDISALSKLTSLSFLTLSGTQVSDISALSNLKVLKGLDLSRMEIDDLRALSGMTSLVILDLQDSKTTAIPESILDLNLSFYIDAKGFVSLYSDNGIFIHGLTLTDQPIEIFSQSKELIRAYYREGIQVPVNECKVIFLGDAESGKTHSIRRLLNNGEVLDDFDGKSTPGIETTVSRIKIKDSEITVNYWDFGGQEIQHSMHRVFLTERTVYVMFFVNFLDN